MPFLYVYVELQNDFAVRVRIPGGEWQSVATYAGSGHFDLCDATIDYISLFIRKAFEQRLNADGTLRRLRPADGWRYGIPTDPQAHGPAHTDSVLMHETRAENVEITCM